MNKIIKIPALFILYTISITLVCAQGKSDNIETEPGKINGYDITRKDMRNGLQKFFDPQLFICCRRIRDLKEDEEIMRLIDEFYEKTNINLSLHTYYNLNSNWPAFFNTPYTKRSDNIELLICFILQGNLDGDESFTVKAFINNAETPEKEKIIAQEKIREIEKKANQNNIVFEANDIDLDPAKDFIKTIINKLSGNQLTGISPSNKYKFPTTSENAKIYQVYGKSPFSEIYYPAKGEHKGIAIIGDYGDNIIAARDGINVEKGGGEKEPTGNIVRIYHEDNTISKYYFVHNIPDNIIGNKIAQGTVIGTIGNTVEEPYSIGFRYALEKTDNGKKVEIDPMPYLTNWDFNNLCLSTVQVYGNNISNRLTRISYSYTGNTVKETDGYKCIGKLLTTNDDNSNFTFRNKLMSKEEQNEKEIKIVSQNDKFKIRDNNLYIKENSNNDPSQSYKILVKTEVKNGDEIAAFYQPLEVIQDCKKISQLFDIASEFNLCIQKLDISYISKENPVLKKKFYIRFDNNKENIDKDDIYIFFTKTGNGSIEFSKLKLGENVKNQLFDEIKTYIEKTIVNKTDEPAEIVNDIVYAISKTYDLAYKKRLIDEATPLLQVKEYYSEISNSARKWEIKQETNSIRCENIYYEDYPIYKKNGNGENYIEATVSDLFSIIQVGDGKLYYKNNKSQYLTELSIVTENSKYLFEKYNISNIKYGNDKLPVNKNSMSYIQFIGGDDYNNIDKYYMTEGTDAYEKELYELARKIVESPYVLEKVVQNGSTAFKPTPEFSNEKRKCESTVIFHKSNKIDNLDETIYSLPENHVLVGIGELTAGKTFCNLIALDLGKKITGEINDFERDNLAGVINRWMNESPSKNKAYEIPDNTNLGYIQKIINAGYLVFFMEPTKNENIGHIEVGYPIPANPIINYGCNTFLSTPGKWQYTCSGKPDLMTFGGGRYVGFKCSNMTINNFNWRKWYTGEKTETGDKPRVFIYLDYLKRK